VSGDGPAGATVVALDLDPAEGTRRREGVACDVTDPRRASAPSCEVVRELGGVDTLVNARTVPRRDPDREAVSTKRHARNRSSRARSRPRCA
jgi:hypothetical protein